MEFYTSPSNEATKKEEQSPTSEKKAKKRKEKRKKEQERAAKKASQQRTEGRRGRSLRATMTSVKRKTSLMKKCRARGALGQLQRRDHR